MKKRKFFISYNFVRFLLWLFTLRYSHDLMPKNNAPVARRLIWRFFIDNLFEFIYSNIIVGKACWILLLGSSFLYEFSNLEIFKDVEPTSSTPGSSLPLTLKIDRIDRSVSSTVDPCRVLFEVFPNSFLLILAVNAHKISILCNLEDFDKNMSLIPADEQISSHFLKQLSCFLIVCSVTPRSQSSCSRLRHSKR